MNISLENAIEKLAANCSPTVEQPSIFIGWAEIVCDVLCTLYPGFDYDDVTEMLYEACKEHQGVYIRG